jgi:hypothetical protein
MSEDFAIADNRFVRSQSSFEASQVKSVAIYLSTAVIAPARYARENTRTHAPTSSNQAPIKSCFR